MKHKYLQFVVLVSNYGRGSFNVTFLDPSPAKDTRTAIFNMQKCFVNGAKDHLDYQLIKEYAHKISDSLLYPLLAMFFQQIGCFTRLPYILGLPENCLRRIGQFLNKKERNMFRLTSRIIGNAVN